MKLIFPENDPRSNGQPFNSNRPWLKQNAICYLEENELTVTFNSFPPCTRPYTPTHVTAVRFEGAKDYDLVSPEFLKSK